MSNITYTCHRCGKVCKSGGGLTNHMNRKCFKTLGGYINRLKKIEEEINPTIKKKKKNKN